LLYYLTDCNDTLLVKEWMSSVETTSKLDLDSTWLTRMQHDLQQTTPVAILSTASPRKFEESVAVALGKDSRGISRTLGKDGWNRYSQEEFPERARDVMSRREVEPIVLYRLGKRWHATLSKSLVKGAKYIYKL
jgi:hypothetical protein